MGLPVPGIGTKWAGTLFVNISDSPFPQGWSERYYLKSASYGDAIADLLLIWDARRAMLMDDCSLVYAYVSDLGIRGDSRVVFPEAGHITGSFSATGAKTLPPYNALQLRLESQALYHTFRPVRGIPSSEDIAGLPPAFGDFFNATKDFGIALIALCYNRVKLKAADPNPALGNFRTITASIPIKFIERRSGRPFGLLRGKFKRQTA